MTMQAEPRPRVRGENVKPRYERRADDWYVEEPDAVHALFDAERFSGRCWDPACGVGTIPKIGAARQMQFIASDREGRGFGTRLDFLTRETDAYLEAIGAPPEHLIFNPPFNLADMFVRKALTIATHKVAALNRLAWLEGQARSAWLQTTPLARVWVFPWRLNMPPGDHAGPRKGGAVAFAWMVWRHGWTGAPQLRWLKKPSGGAP